LTASGELDAGRHVGAGPILGLFGRRAEMRRHHNLGQLEQRAVGAWLLGVDVETGGANVSARDGVGQRGLVDQSTAGCVDDDDTRLGFRERLFADQPRRLRSFRQVHRDEVGATE
jgi:hypothetical protein